MKDVYIMGAVRTAIGKYGGSLKSVPAHELGALVIKEALARAEHFYNPLQRKFTDIPDEEIVQDDTAAGTEA